MVADNKEQECPSAGETLVVEVLCGMWKQEETHRDFFRGRSLVDAGFSTMFLTTPPYLVRTANAQTLLLQ